jgi:3' terminal RNA ribose 2'-O-methyltransferase Hen1
MILTITSTAPPATDLGYLLHKNPVRPQTFALNFGQAHVFYPDASAERCTAALLLDIDPIGLVRRAPGNEWFGLGQYVNDRPYVASSFMSVAMAEVFGTALSGRSRERPELAERPLLLTARLAAVPARGGDAIIRRLFAPLGYEITVEPHPLDPMLPDWGDSAYFSLTLSGEIRLQDLLTHIYVLIPVLDGDKHYWVGDDEVAKLLRHGEGWLAAHPERELIASRYLKRRRLLVQDALARLVAEETAPDDPDAPTPMEQTPGEDPAIEERVGLHQQRLGAVLTMLRDTGARRILDLGCGEGRLLRLLAGDPQFTEIVGVDVSARALGLARERVLDRLPPARRDQVRLLLGALTYRDRRLSGFDAAAVVEVIEHLDPARLAAFERTLFEFARPTNVVVTTPNIEYNVRWPDLPAGKFRHRDHRFEWTRSEFRHWTDHVADQYGYRVRLLPIGPDDPEVGPPTQLALFTARSPEPAG